MDKNLVSQILRTVASNVNDSAEVIGLDKGIAEKINTMMSDATHKLNANGTLDKIPAEINIHFIKDKVQAIAMDALSAEAMPTQAELQDDLTRAITNAQSVRLAQERRDANLAASYPSRGAGGRRIVRPRSERPSAGESYGGSTAD